MSQGKDPKDLERQKPSGGKVASSEKVEGREEEEEKEKKR